MRDKIFFTDLDSTLILNSKDSKYLDTSKYVCVSRKYGNPAGFMTIENFRKLQEINKRYTIVPITSRCLGSYMDVNLGFTPEYSLVDNGAILLNGREILVHWMNDSEKMTKDSHEAFRECRKYLISLDYFEKWGSQFVLDFSTDRNDISDPITRMNLMNEIAESPIFKYCTDGKIKSYISSSMRSILLVDSKMTKDKSIERFLESIGSHENARIYVAGDSSPDYCMLEAFENSFGTDESPANHKFNMRSDDFRKDSDNISKFTSFILDSLLKS